MEECNQREEYQIIGLFYGHTHGDFVFGECSFPMVSTGCAKLEYLPGLKPKGAACPYREADKRTQELWDSLLVDFENQELHFIRFGAGEDRRVSFRKKANRYFSSVNVALRRRRPKIWAHRGASGHAPENTIPAFELALLMRADGIELDVQLSKDGVPVVIHDERLERLSEGGGWVKEYTLEELQALNVNKRFPAYGKVRIPTLEEVYDLVKKSDLTINLELKNGVVDYAGLEEKVLRLAEEKGLAEKMVYSSFNHYSIRKIQQLLPGAKTAFLYADGFLDMAGYAARYGAYALHPSCSRVCYGVANGGAGREVCDGAADGGAGREVCDGAADGEMSQEKYGDIIRQCHEKDIRVHVWAVNEQADFERMRALGADAVITDYIERG